MKHLVLTSLMMVVLFVGASSVYACTCANRSAREKFRSADVIFVGEIVEKSFTGQNDFYVYSVQFKVEKYWKGAARRNLKVLFGFDSPGMCGDLPLTEGKRYLIYAKRKKEGLATYIDCGPNRMAEDASDVLKKLNSFWFRMFARFFPYPKF